MNCLRYNDQFSAGNSAYNDLLIGEQHKCVGCNSKWMDRAKPGHIVVICAKTNGYLNCVIAILQDKLTSCFIWKDEGGREWSYNWTYKPITKLFIYTDELKSHMVSFCDLRGLKYNNIFNSRFCSNKLKEAIRELHRLEGSSIYII